MSNNVTRKGLAFGALVALTSSVIAGAPAQAAGEINFAPTAGTSYNTIAGEKFTLEASFAPGFAPAAPGQLKYAVTTDGTPILAAAALTSSAAASATPTTMAQTTSATTKVIASGRGAHTDRSFLVLQFAAATDTESVTVAAFADANNNDTLDAGEWSTSRTLGFKKVADVTATTTVTAPVVGDSSIKATINFGDLNTQQIAIGNFASKFAVGTAAASQTGTVEAYNSDGTISVTATTSVSAAGTVYTVTPLYELDGTVADGSTIGSAGTATSVAAGFAFFASVKGSAASGQITTATSGASAYTDASNSANNVTAATGAITVKRNDTFAVTAVVKNNASTPAVVAGQVVNVTVSTNAALNTATDSTSVKLTVNGTQYTSASALPGQGSVAKLAVTSNASGEVVVNLSSVGYTDGQTVTLAFDSQNITVSTVVTQAELDYTVAESNTNDIYSTTPGATQTLTYSVKDQFGVALAGSAYRVKATVTGGTANTFYGNVVNGAATINVTDSQLTTASSWTDNSVAATLEVQSSSTLNWAADTTTGRTVTGDTTTIKYTTTANNFSVAPAVTHVTNGAGTTAAYNATSNFKQTITQSALADLTTAPTASNATWARLSFTGTNQGAKVDISAPGAFIWANGKANNGSASMQAGASADVIYVASNTVGTKTVTFTTGAVTKTVDVVFISLDAAEATAANFAVAVATAAQAGRSIDATVTVTDKWGNPVSSFDVTASVAGVASVNGGFSANVTTDANGKATVKLTAGVNDLGDAVVTFSDNDNATSTNVTAVAKTVVFGQTDGYIDILNEKRASVTWSMAKGKRVAFYLNGVRKYNFVQTGDAELNLQFNLKKGTHNIKLVIGGQIVDDITVKITK